MSPEELELIEKQVRKDLQSITREGGDVLYEFLDENNFFRVPASIRHHENYTGGLMVHEFRLKTKFWEKMQFYELMDEESANIICYGHDLCKLFDYAENEHGLWKSNKNKKLYGHGALSVAILTDCGIHLTPEEEACIRYHMGGFYSNEYLEENPKHRSWLKTEYPYNDVRRAIEKFATVQIFASTDMEVSKWIEGKPAIDFTQQLNYDLDIPDEIPIDDIDISKPIAPEMKILKKTPTKAVLDDVDDKEDDVKIDMSKVKINIGGNK